MQYSIVNYQAIPIESSIFRLDSEFFHPQILAAKNTIRTQNNITLRKAKAKIIHPTEIKREYTKQGIQILLAQNIRDNFLDFSVEVFMPYEVEQSLLRNRLKIGDLVLTRSGANYGQCAVYLGIPSKIFACADDLVIAFEHKEDAERLLLLLDGASFGVCSRAQRGSFGTKREPRPHASIQ